jgi:DNA-binding transcriptional ArsR family regulator
LTSSWTAPIVDLVTGRLALLADPTRLRLLLALQQQREQNVQQLADGMASTPQNVSRHLGMLHRSGIVARHRQGSCVYYSLADYSACRLLEQTLTSVTGQVEELADIVGLTP